MITIFILVLNFVPVVSVLHSALFKSPKECSEDNKFASDIITTLFAVSKISCSRNCMRNQDCLSFNYFSKRTTDNCELLAKTANGSCENLVTEPESVYMELVAPCIGGSLLNGRCVCGSVYFTGGRCDRFFSDCSEATSNFPSGVKFMPITPIGTTGFIFPVICDYDSDGATVIMERGFGRLGCTENWYNQNWQWFQSSSNGYASDRTGCGYWLRNEAIHQLTQQPGNYYLLHIELETDGNDWIDVYYSGFRVESEALDYAIHYDGYETDSTGDDGFGSAMNGQPFRTFDHDTTGCASLHQSGWWYNTNCSVPNLNHPTAVTWPVSGIDENIINIMMTIYPAIVQ